MKDIVWHDHKITRAERAANKNQKPCLLWFTGLSGSGKSTIANALDVALHERGYHTFLLDGDNVRHGLCSDLGFSDDDRVENIRRIGEVSKLFADSGLIVLSAFISPFVSDRRLVRKLFPAGEFIEVFMDTPLDTCEDRDPKGQLFPAGEFIEVFMDTPLDTCEDRDPKGLYKKARAGEIKSFTGIDSPYETPPHPELRLDTSTMSIDECVEALINHLSRNGLIR